MKANEAAFLELIKKSPQFSIPIYQRTYSWSEKERAEKLSSMEVDIWKAPVLPKETLDSYRTQTARTVSYTIDDHPHLCGKSGNGGSKTRALFEILRKEILALDPCVTEEFLKLYVAYKAETNFVDVKGLGRWGNGDVEVFLSPEDDIPYIMSLIMQSFERHMGNGGEEE
jgi:predicted transport protein